MGDNLNLLEWDSQFFGFKIASVKPVKLEQNELNKIIKELSSQDFKLAYFFVNSDDEISNNSLKGVSGLLVDEKVTFIIRISEQFKSAGCDFIKPYNLKYSSEKLKSLTLQSGAYSRFKIDTNFRNNEYQRLYTEWIDKSVRKVISDEILVYYENNDEKGFITLVTRNNTGSIGLIAVDQKERGKSIGRNLVNAAFSYFIGQKVFCVEVVTQLANKGACGFYKSLGFEVKNIVNVYHLWIK